MRMVGPLLTNATSSVSHVHDTTRPAHQAIVGRKLASPLEPHLLFEVHAGVGVNPLDRRLELHPRRLAAVRGQPQLHATTGHLRRRAAESPRTPRNSLEVVL